MMMTTKIKPLDEIKAELEEVRAKKAAQNSATEQTRRDWYGLIYLGKDGYCSISTFENGEEKPVCLGRSIEFIPYLRDQGIDGNDVAAVLAAHKKFQVGQNGVINHHQNPLTHGQGNKDAPETNRGHIKHLPDKAPSYRHQEIGKNPLKCFSEAQNRGITKKNRERV
jgi:hypothetical protein